MNKQQIYFLGIFIILLSFSLLLAYDLFNPFNETTTMASGLYVGIILGLILSKVIWYKNE